MHVIAYASRCCSDAEAKDVSSEGKLLAPVFAVTKFHHYLAGTVFTIVTDNGTLQYLEVIASQQHSPPNELGAALPMHFKV